MDEGGGGADRIGTKGGANPETGIILVDGNGTPEESAKWTVDLEAAGGVGR